MAIPTHAVSSGMNAFEGVVMEIVITFALVYTVYATAIDPKKGSVGHIAAETVNGCCLYCYMAFVFLLLVLEAAVTGDVFLNHNWEEDFPVDPTGNFNEFKHFVRKNFEMCKWIGLSVVCVQGLCMLLAMILKALGPHPERCYDSDDDYTPDRVPLLKNYVQPHYVVGDPIYRSKNDSWNVRINDQINQ